MKTNVWHHKIEKVKIYVDDHIDSRINLKETADRFSVSYYHFLHKFKDQTSESFGNYIQRIKLETAAYLVKFNKQPFTEIAFLTGYESYPSFSNAFDKKFSAYPIAYRKNYRASFASNNDLIMNPEKVYKSAERFYFWRSLGKGGYADLIKNVINSIKQLMRKYPELFSEPALILRCPDMPGITHANQCRWDAGFTVSRQIAEEFDVILNIEFPEVLFQNMAPGKYALFIIQQHEADGEKVYEEIYCSMLSKWQLQLRLAEAYTSYSISYQYKSPPFGKIFIPIY